MNTTTDQRYVAAECTISSLGSSGLVRLHFVSIAIVLARITNRCSDYSVFATIRAMVYLCQSANFECTDDSGLPLILDNSSHLTITDKAKDCCSSTGL